MEINWKRLTAMGCSILYILLFLFLPVISIKAFGYNVSGYSGMDLLSETAWSYLPLIFGIGMAVCAMVTPSIVGGIVCSVGSIMPMITYFGIRGSIIRGEFGIDSVFEYGFRDFALLSESMTVGAGVIIPILLGIGAAVLCFLANLGSRPKERTAGFSAGTDDDW